MSHSFTGRDLSCIRGERLVFAGLSFRLEPGGALVLRGPNGSGKSSLLRLAAGLARPSKGVVAWNGGDIAADRASHHARLVYIGHADAVKPALTAAENLAFWTGLRGGGDVAGGLRRLGLGDLAGIPARYLSSGEKRRLALAVLAASPAELWLLDEPAVGLDAASVALLEALIAEHRRSGGMVVLSTHTEMTLVTFFIIAGALFPLGVGPEPGVLARIAGGVIWVTALLAVLLSLDRLFQQDFEDGSLDLLVLAPMPLEATVMAKAAAHWLTTGLPLIAASPVLAVLLNLPAAGYPVLLAAMALGTPSLSLIGAIGAALSLGARRGGVLMSLLVLPLYIPVLIFGVAAVDAAVMGMSARSHLLFLGAILAAALPLAPWAAAAALRQAAE